MLLPRHEAQMFKEEITQDTIQYFRKHYGDRFVRALRAVEENRVKKYVFYPSETSIWIVKGHLREYMVIPTIYCSCRSFYQDVVINRKVSFCYHLLAQNIAEIRNHFQIIKSTDAKRRQLLTNWRRTD